MNRKLKFLNVLILFLLAMALLYWGVERADRTKKSPKRVVFITIDTLRADHVSSYGYLRETTPFIDSLAADGVRFEKARTACSHTGPSHASMFTGLLPFEHGVLENGMSLDTSIFGMSQLFQERGYSVAGFSAVGFMQGKMAFPELDPKYLTLPQSRRRKHWYRNAQDNVDRVISWMEDEKPENFYIWVHFYDVHQWAGRGQLPKRYSKRKSESGNQDLINRIVSAHNLDPDFFNEKKGIKWALDGYDARLSFVDDQIKRLYEYLSNKGLNSEALWVITSDHGEGLGNHGYEGHGRYVYEEQLRVPLVIHKTDKSMGPRVVRSDVQTIDIFPTVAELMGVSLESKSIALHGDSLVRFLLSSDSTFDKSRRFVAQRRPRDSLNKRPSWEKGTLYSFQDGKFKLIYHTEGEDEFYNLHEDPFEIDNLNQEQKAKEEIDSLRTGIETLLKNRTLSEDEGEALPTETLEELKALGYL